MSFDLQKQLLPDYPRTKHLPYKPNSSREDLIASAEEASIIFKSKFVYLEEKIDGANLGVFWSDNGPVIRNRSHILRKGYRKETSAKMQFASTWSWIYDQRKKFDKLEKMAGKVSIYGEWMVAQHGVYYNKLPSLFIAFDLFDQESKKFIDTEKARFFLSESGFDIPTLLKNKISNYQELDSLLEEKSAFSEEKREGIYIKISDGNYITDRFKIVRQDFVSGKYWSDTNYLKNKVKNK